MVYCLHALLVATSALGLGENDKSSHHWCYCTMYTDIYISELQNLIKMQFLKYNTRQFSFNSITKCLQGETINETTQH